MNILRTTYIEGLDKANNTLRFYQEKIVLNIALHDIVATGEKDSGEKVTLTKMITL